MPFRVTNISNEVLNTKTEYNKVIVIDDIAIQPGQSQFYNWKIVPTNVNILKLQNLVIVESVSINDYNFIQQDVVVENNIIEIPNEEVVELIEEVEGSIEVEVEAIVEDIIEEIINEEVVAENVTEEIKIETKPKTKNKKEKK